MRKRRTSEAFSRLAVALGIAALGCAGSDADNAPPEPVGPGAAVSEENATGEDRPEPEDAEPSAPPKRIFAKRFVVNVREAPDREATALGYLRAGAVLQAKTAEPVARTPRCRGGWYELTTGGFVCNVRDVIAFYGDDLPEIRARQPNRDDKLPYEYGFVRGNAPMYRRLPSPEEVREHEGGRSTARAEGGPGTAANGSMQAMAGAAMGARTTGMNGAASAATLATTAAAQTPTTMGAAGATQGGASTALAGARRMATAMSAPEESDEAVAEAVGPGRVDAPSSARTTAMQPTAMQPSGMAGAESSAAEMEATAMQAGTMDAASMQAVASAMAETDDSEASDEGEEEEPPPPSHSDVVAALEDPDAGTPTLDLLTHDTESVVRMTLMRGFFVSLDRTFERNGRRYWRTQSNGFIPWAQIVTKDGSDFQGVAFEEGQGLPAAWVSSIRGTRYQRTEQGRLRPARGDSRADYHHGFLVAGTVEEGGRVYVYDADGNHYRDRDLRVAELREPPSEVPEGKKWIDVDLSAQTVVAYEGTKPVWATIASTGKVQRRDIDELNWETLKGVWQINSKHLTHNMDGDNAIDGPYSLEDVPYVMYFELAYAFHAAFWHNRFGHPKSHGCVNLAPFDAKWLWNWAEPHIPDGWHGVYSRDHNPGTWVWVHGDTP